MKLSRGRIARYRDIASLLWRYGRSDLAGQLANEGEDGGETPPDSTKGTGSPEELARDLEAMGPTYVKLGQVLAGRPDLLPEAYLQALARLQDQVKPFPFSEVETIVQDQLGVRISKAFSHFEATPIAAASLGQVHLAALRDGRPVAVKVQRPGIRAQIDEDFEVLGQIAKLLDKHTEAGRTIRFQSVLEEFRTTIHHELDYEREAHNLRAVRENLEDFDLIVIPQPVPDYTTRSVLTMEYVSGRKVTRFGPLDRLELDGSELLNQLFSAYLKQVLVDGLFHADPHPGNVFVTDDGRIALLDLGMVGHTSPGMQDKLIKLLTAIGDGKGEEAAEAAIEMSDKVDGFEPTEFRRRVSKAVALHRDESLERMNIGRSVLALCKDARETGLFVPTELTLLGKTLLQLEQVGRILDPEFDPNAAIRDNVGELMTRRLRKNMSAGGFFTSLSEMRGFLTALPSRLNRILDVVPNGQLEVKVRLPDAPRFIDAMQKIANRITAGIILAALIVGAALLMRVQTDFELFGYPGLAIACFLFAAAGGLWLLINIVIQDHRRQRRGGQ